MPFTTKVIIVAAAIEGCFLFWYLVMAVGMWRAARDNEHDMISVWMSLVDFSRLTTVIWMPLFLLFAFDLQTTQAIPGRFTWFLIAFIILSVLKAGAVTALFWHLKGQVMWEGFKQWLRRE